MFEQKYYIVVARIEVALRSHATAGSVWLHSAAKNLNVHRALRSIGLRALGLRFRGLGFRV